jgi:hypothetical protein
LGSVTGKSAVSGWLTDLEKNVPFYLIADMIDLIRPILFNKYSRIVRMLTEIYPSGFNI